MFANILLEKEQQELLITVAEAARNVQRRKRQKFSVIELVGGTPLEHPGLPDGQLEVYIGDIQILGRTGLIALSHDSDGGYSFDVTPLGFQYYEYLKRLDGQPIRQMETEVREYIEAERFQQKYPQAYQKWKNAEQLLWSSDTDQQFTTIGHLCREAMQEFISALIQIYQPHSIDNDKTHTVSRLKSILNAQSQLGTTETPFLKAIITYWGTLSDLVQRQEHGGQRESQPLIWDDGRRIVFQTIAV